MFRRKFCAMLAGVPLFGRFMPGAAVVTLSSLPVEPEPAVDRAIGYHEALDVVRATLKANHAFREGLESVIAGRIHEHCFSNWGGTEFSQNAARSVMELLLGVGIEVTGTERADL